MRNMSFNTDALRRGLVCADDLLQLAGGSGSEADIRRIHRFAVSISRSNVRNALHGARRPWRYIHPRL